MTADAPGCQPAGFHMCASSDPAMAGIPLPPCCPGVTCREDPELPGTGDKFCMEAEPIPEGGDCRVTRRQSYRIGIEKLILRESEVSVWREANPPVLLKN